MADPGARMTAWGAAGDSAGGPPGRPAGRGEDGERLAGQAELLHQMKELRRRARKSRHAYWFPLLAFGLLVAGALPLYLQPGFGPGRGSFTYSAPGYSFQRFLPGLSGFAGVTQPWLGYYWAAALLGGLLATQLFFRWHARRVGLRTPSRGYLITTASAAALVIAVPLAIRWFHWPALLVLLPGDLFIRGTFPLVIIGFGLLALAWTERSAALSVIAVVYTAAALLASLYNLSNTAWRLGWTLPPGEQGLPNVLLCAALLLLSGAGAGVAALCHRRRHPA